MKTWFKPDFEKKNAWKVGRLNILIIDGAGGQMVTTSKHFIFFQIEKIVSSNLFVLPILRTPCLYLVEIEWLKFFDKYAGSEGLRIVENIQNNLSSDFTPNISQKFYLSLPNHIFPNAFLLLKKWQRHLWKAKLNTFIPFCTYSSAV